MREFPEVCSVGYFVKSVEIGGVRIEGNDAAVIMAFFARYDDGRVVRSRDNGLRSNRGAVSHCTVISAAVRGIIMMESDSVIEGTVK
jgi:hypothetical protein